MEPPSSVSQIKQGQVAENKTEKPGSKKSSISVATGIIVIIGGTIATALLYSRAGLASLSIEGGSLLMGGGLIAYGCQHKRSTTEEVSPDETSPKSEKKAAPKVFLPQGEGQEYKRIWDKIGVEWLESNENGSYVTSAKLPEGWKEVLPPSYAGYSYFVDPKGVVRIEVYMKTTYTEFVSWVKELSEEQSQELSKELFGPNKLERDFERLLRAYYSEIHTTTGHINAQNHINQAWEKLKDFADEHPEFNKRVPERYIDHGGPREKTDDSKVLTAAFSNAFSN